MILRRRHRALGGPGEWAPACRGRVAGGVDVPPLLLRGPSRCAPGSPFAGSGWPRVTVAVVMVAVVIKKLHIAANYKKQIKKYGLLRSASK